MSLFYVYALENPITNLPFYIGKGKWNRAWEHLSEIHRKPIRNHNKHKLNTIKQIIDSGKEVIVKIIDSNLTEEIAFELEVFMIDMLGRKDKGTGVLTNMTDGGEGLSGLIRDMFGENNPNYGKRGEKAIWWGRKHTDETKLKQSLSQKGKALSEEHKQALRKPKSEAGRLAICQARLDNNYRPTEETKLKISESLKGRPSPNKGKVTSLETRIKISEAGKGLIKPKTLCEHCGLLIANSSFNRFHGKNCKSNPNANEIESYKYEIVACPHCGVEGGGSNMKRYHFDNCKELLQ